MARKSMSLLDLKAWIHIHIDKLRGARISNIYYSKDDGRLFIKLKPPGGEEAIIVAEAGKRIHHTHRLKPPSDYKPHPLVVTARKHMRGSRIEEVKQVGGDRIIAIRSSTGHSIVVELVPRGVILHLDPDNRIIVASSYEKFKDRRIAPKEEYKPPPSSGVDPLTLDPGALKKLLTGQKDLVRGLVRAAKIPGEYAEEAIYRAGLDPRAKPDTITVGDLETLLKVLDALWKESLQGRGYLAMQVPEAVAFKPRRFPPETVREYRIFDEALDELFTMPGGRAGEGLDAERARLLKSLEEASKTAIEYEKRAEELKLAASMIASRYDLVNSLLECARKGGDCGVEIDKRRGIVVLDVDGVRVEARLGENVDQLILRLFREAGELEAKARRAKEARKTIEERLAELEVKARARQLAAKAKARRRMWFERFHWTITGSGILVIGGRDASQNEAVVRRYLGEGDIFMHADIHGAPAVVIKAGGVEPPGEDLRDAAVIAVAYSKAWKAGVGSVAVYWVWADQVSRSPPSGEYLAKGGFIIRGRRNYLSPIETRLYLGVALDPEDAPLVLVGSRRVVERYSVSYLELRPGDVKVEELAGVVKRSLQKPLGRDRAHIPLALPEDEIIARLPGRSRITGVWKGRGEVLAPTLGPQS